MFISAIRIRNFRSHRDTSVKLYPTTAFVGHGSSGKSNFFNALVNFSVVLRGRVGEAFSSYPWGTFSAARSWGISQTSAVSFEATICPKTPSDVPFKYTFAYKQVNAQTEEPAFQITKERLERNGEVIFDRDDIESCKLKGLEHLADDRSLLSALRLARTAEADLLELARGISRIGKYRLEPSLLQRPSHIPPPSELEAQGGMWLDYGGDNLASVLYQLAETNKPRLEAIIAAVKSVFPQFEGFSFNFVGEGKVGFSVKYSHHKEPILAPVLSHGMLLFIGLMTLLHTPTSPDVILLEEPENGLDAKAIRVFYQKLVESNAGGGKQILLSSHSPFVLCEAWNGPSRKFIYHITDKDGQSQVHSVEEVTETYTNTLQSDGTMSLRHAERIMSERWQAEGTRRPN